MEQQACLVRRGHNGTKAERERGDPRGWERARSEPSGGFVAAAYRHRMSRAQDPQLHTHVVAANMARGRDGRWTALDARHIYEHAKAAGYLYEAHLRHAVRERLPWAEWGTVREGIAELEQVPAGVREEFSTRRRRILERQAELQAAGIAIGHAGRERIAKDTREPKSQITESDWRSQVQARAAEHGLGLSELEQLTSLSSAAGAQPQSIDDLAGRFFSPQGLTATTNTFHERDVAIAVAAAHRQGAAVSEIQALAKRAIERPQAVLVDQQPRRYTTQELLAAEQQILEHAVDGRGMRAAIVDRAVIGASLDSLPVKLSAEQAGVVGAIACSGNRIDTVEALAGTGKTTSAAALREIYEHAGYRVLGAAPTGRATRELKERAGIVESRTLDAWAIKLAADPDSLRYVNVDDRGPRRVPAVMIIDEAGMAHTRLSAEVIDRAIGSRVKVIAIGDSGQLSSVRAGGWLGALTRTVGSHELREVMRQRDPRERRGLSQVHRGQPNAYVDMKTGRGELTVFGGDRPGIDAELAAVDAWLTARDQHGPAEAVLVCRDNDRRERLNDLARARLNARGELGEGIEIDGHDWAVGDRVIARRNDRGRDLDNGMRGTIVAVDHEFGITIESDTRGTRVLDPEYLRDHVQRAYAVTGHGMQGGTVEWAAVIGQPGDFTRNWSYTALSRARHPTQILLIDEPTAAEEARAEIAPASTVAQETPIERLARRMRERDDEDLALEQLEHAELARTGDADPHRDRPRAEPERKPAGLAEKHDLRAGTLAALAAVDLELDQVRAALADPAIATAREIADLRNRLTRIETSSLGDLKPRGLRDRGAQKQRAGQRQAQIDRLHAQEAALLEHVADPAETLRHAEELREQQGQLIQRSIELHDQAVREELARNPPWLQATLGPEPEPLDLRRRWERTAREIASHRLRNGITDPNELGVNDRDHALTRAIGDTRIQLGLEHPAPGHDLGEQL
jgi:ATP-dependent exoDNAse (exonuclease V) alpha subunit